MRSSTLSSFSAPVIWVRRLSPELAGDLAHLLLDHAEDLLLVRKQVLVVGDRAAQSLELFLDLVALQAGEAAELHLEDGRGLLG